MTYTTSYTWRGYQRSEAKRLLRHDARDVERAQGKEAVHSNQMIRPEWTARNQTFMNDGNGRLVPMTSVDDAMEFLDQRLSELQNTRTLKSGKVVPVAHRKDANVIVSFVLQLDPRFTRDPDLSDEEFDNLTQEEYEALPPDIATMSEERIEQTERYLDVMLEEVIDRMGSENIVSASIHWDESHPHIQVLAVPEHQGQLSYTKKFGGGSKFESQQLYKEAHNRMRTRLKDAGYEASMERLGRRKHESLDDFKKRRKKERDLRALGREIGGQQDDLNRDAARMRMQQIELEKERKKAASERSEAAAERRELEHERWELKREREQGYAAGLEEGRERVFKEWQEVRSLQGKYDHAIKEAEQASPDWSSEAVQQVVTEAVWRQMPGVVHDFLGDLDRTRRDRGEEPIWVPGLERRARQELGDDWRNLWTKRENSRGVRMDRIRRYRENVMREANELKARQRDEGLSL